MSIIDKLKTVKREYLILSVVVIVLVLLLIFNKKNRKSYDVPKLDNLKLEDISKFEIRKQSNVLILSRENDKWHIQPQKYLADKKKVEEMLEKVAKLKIDDLVSESKNYLLYELDEENKITVLVYKSDKVIRNYDIGKVSQTRNHTFVKLAGRSEVYHANGDFRDDFDKKIDDLRDKNVLSFVKNDLKEVTLINASGSQLKLKKEIVMPPVDVEAGTNKKPEKKEPVTKWTGPKGKEIDEKELDDILDSLEKLDCESFVENKTKDDYKMPVYTFILKGAQEYSLKIYKMEQDDKFPAVSSEREYPFYLAKYLAERVMKKFNELYK